MQRIDGPTVSAALPAPQATGAGGSAPGFFGRGDVATGTPATTLDVDWANMVQEEIVSVVAHAGIALDKANHGQLLEALFQMFVAQGAQTGVVVGQTEATIPLAGGFSIKVGTLTGPFTEGPVQHQFDNPFPNKCWVAVAVAVNSTGSGNRDVWVQRETISPAGFTMFAQWSGGSGTSNSIEGVDYISIGN